MSTIGDNIRALRNAFGETQEELALGLSDTGHESSISRIGMYETGKRIPKPELISTIARRYAVSEEDLISGDLSGLKLINIDWKAFLHHLDTVFPIVSSDEALQSKSFRRAFETHRKLYQQYKRVPNDISFDEDDSFPDLEDVFYACIEDYAEAYDDEKAQRAATVGILALYYLQLFELKSIERYCASDGLPVYLEQFLFRHQELWEGLEEYKEELISESKEQMSVLLCEGNRITMCELKKELKQSSSVYRDLADYYLALPYWCNLDGNEWSDATNCKIALEMMQSFASVGNQYAKRFLYVFD